MKKLKVMALILFTVVAGSSQAAKDRDINRDLVINANVEDVWLVLGKDFANAYVWSSQVKHSEALNKESLNGSSCTARGCDVAGFGKIEEKVLEYSDKDYLLTYEVYQGLPKMMKYAKNTWTLEATPEGKTKVTMRLRAQTGGFMGWMMGGMMERKMTKLIDQAIEELKYYIETKQVHPRALKASLK